MLYFICCTRNNGVIKEGSVLRWMMCALERLVLSRNEKGNKCRNRRKKSTGFREMVGACMVADTSASPKAIVLASMLGC